MSGAVRNMIRAASSPCASASAPKFAALYEGVLTLQATAGRAGLHADSPARVDHPHACGTVIGIDTAGNAIALAAEDGAAPAVHTLPASADVTLNGIPSTLANLPVGSFAQIHFSAPDKRTILRVCAFTGGRRAIAIFA